MQWFLGYAVLFPGETLEADSWPVWYIQPQLPGSPLLLGFATGTPTPGMLLGLPGCGHDLKTLGIFNSAGAPVANGHVIAALLQAMQPLSKRPLFAIQPALRKLRTHL